MMLMGYFGVMCIGLFLIGAVTAMVIYYDINSFGGGILVCSTLMLLMLIIAGNRIDDYILKTGIVEYQKREMVVVDTTRAQVIDDVLGTDIVKKD